MRAVATSMLAFLLILAHPVGVQAQVSHPRLLLSGSDVQLIRENLGKYTFFDQAFGEARETVHRALARPIEVPMPVDAGGYTHEKHKQNYKEMQLAGILFQVTNEDRYAGFIRDMLLNYAALYPTLGKHQLEC